MEMRFPSFILLIKNYVLFPMRIDVFSLTNFAGVIAGLLFLSMFCSSLLLNISQIQLKHLAAK